jgi:uncharacterized membrane protein
MKKIILLLCVLLPIIIFGKSYFYPEVKTEVRLAANGDAWIVQERTYDFSGSYSYAFVDLKKQGADNIIFNRLLEQTETGWRELEPEISDNSKSLYVRWNYAAQDETKTFKLDYTIIGAVKRYQDVAEFYWKIIEDEHEKIDRITIKLIPPQPSPELFKMYIHSRARPGRLGFDEEKAFAVVEQNSISRNAFVEVRMLVAPNLFPNTSIIPRRQYEKILQDEKQNFIVSIVKKLILIPLGLLLLIILPIILVLVFYRKYGREPQIPYLGTYEHEPPRKALPIVIPAILHQKPDKTVINQETFRGMFATLLDLCTQGIVSIHEIKAKGKYQFILEKPERVAGLDSTSQEIVKFFFEKAGQDSTVLTDKALKDYATKHASSFQALLQKLFDSSRGWWEKILSAQLIDPDSTKAYHKFILYALISIFGGVAMLAIGLSALFTVPFPVSFIIPFMAGVFVFVIFMFIGRVILRWSPLAYEEQKRWLNFKRFITDFSAIQQAPISLLPIWEHYFVYAVVLGVAQKFLKNITNLAAERQTALVLPVWYSSALAGPAKLSSFAQSMSNFESFTSNFTSMMNSFSTSVATGGGFSGGGGGGGGGSSGAG